MILIGSLTGCRTPQQRHDVLILKYGDLCTKDTVVVKDTIIKTTRVLVPERKDSFIITRDTVIETKLFLIEKKGNRFNVTAKKDTIIFRDTIPFKVEVPGTSFIQKQPLDKQTIIVVCLIGFIIGLVIGIKIFK